MPTAEPTPRFLSLTCQDCGYDLRDLPDLTCPECGTPWIPPEGFTWKQVLRPLALAIVSMMISVHVFLFCLDVPSIYSSEARGFNDTDSFDLDIQLFVHIPVFLATAAAAWWGSRWNRIAGVAFLVAAGAWCITWNVWLLQP